MTPWQQLLLVWLVAVVAQSLGWLWQRKRSNAGIVDVVWSFGVGGAAVLVAATGSGALLPRVLLADAGRRLGPAAGPAPVASRACRAEDGRYAQLRQRWGNDQRKFFAIFQFQALLMALFSPCRSWRWPRIPSPTGTVVPGRHRHVAAERGGETVADAQLAQFRTNPGNRGKTCRAGLWRYSRHPNYFFEWLHWFAYVLLAVGSPWPGWPGSDRW
jgi:steroid 5-alpha reductase family enzyme